MPTKKVNFLRFFLIAIPISPVFKNKKLKISKKTVEIKVFLNYFACWWKNPDPKTWPADPEYFLKRVKIFGTPFLL
jgi:hypothetical protein